MGWGIEVYRPRPYLLEHLRCLVGAGSGHRTGHKAGVGKERGARGRTNEAPQGHHKSVHARYPHIISMDKYTIIPYPGSRTIVEVVLRMGPTLRG